MQIHLLHEIYYDSNENIISSQVIKAYVCANRAEVDRQDWEDSNDDERAEYSIQEIDLEDY